MPAAEAVAADIRADVVGIQVAEVAIPAADIQEVEAAATPEVVVIRVVAAVAILAVIQEADVRVPPAEALCSTMPFISPPMKCSRSRRDGRPSSSLPTAWTRAAAR